jgi:hypothetical protein
MPIFEFFDNTLAGTSADVLGLWCTAPLSSPEAVAFSSVRARTSELPPETPVWRVNLPADLNLAASHLTEGEARLETSRKVIQEAPHRLDAFVRSQSAAPSFDISLERREFAKPEAELLVLLGEIQAGRAPVSFGLGEKLVGGWQQATDRFQALALESRDTLIRTFVFAARGAVQLSVMLTMPGGALLALPAIWKFINQILADK